MKNSHALLAPTLKTSAVAGKMKEEKHVSHVKEAGHRNGTELKKMTIREDS